LITFPGRVSTGAGKVENWARMTRFCIRNIPTLSGTQFLSFCNQYDWKIFRLNFDDSSGTGNHRSRQSWKFGPGWLGFAPYTYVHFLGCNFYRFPSVRLNNVSVEFWRLFRSGHHRSKKIWKRALDDSV